ncbi:hypothetical protein BG011_007140 [Mortierella polycephala]|uniref:Phosphatidylglycerol/phosphatidylinositol transfer protein n=1 Tax=Mortierella polycephala TaxID=41804 RepID=A0A9P6PT51_9FUNG|nr:hypothetical protein BG011_007140 [Mortierella polycephala]
MKYFAAIAAFACLAFANAQVIPPITSCATGSTDITIDTFTLEPYPLCIGESVCATGNGTLSTPVVDGATLSITGKYLGRVVYTDSHDLCELMGDQGHPCPIPTTLTSITACVLVKPSAPANVPVVLTVLAMNGNGNVLFCQTASGVLAQICPP